MFSDRMINSKIFFSWKFLNNQLLVEKISYRMNGGQKDQTFLYDYPTSLQCYFLWGYVKNIVYSASHTTFESKKQKILYHITSKCACNVIPLNKELDSTFKIMDIISNRCCNFYFLNSVFFFLKCTDSLISLISYSGEK